MKISLTEFVDFTITPAGPARITKVREIKYRDQYGPGVDLWKPMREGIVAMHKVGRVDRKGFDAIIAAQTHDLKLRHYPIARDGYLRFIGRKPKEYFTPPGGTWKHGDLEVRVNPEVGLHINGRPTV